MFQDKTVAVTGASSGLGRELSLQLSQRGANLVLFSRDRGRLKETAKRCTDAGAKPPLVVTGDVSRPKDCVGLVDVAVGRFGQLDYLVANAGMSMWARFDQIEDVSVFRRLMETNFLGVVNSIHAALPEIRKNRGGIAVVNSIQAKFGVPYHSAYSASKHAVEGFCDALRSELRGSGVRLLVAYPHWISGTGLRASALNAAGRPIGESKRAHSSDAVPAAKCAAKIVQAMLKGRSEVYIPRKFRWLPWLKLFAPNLLRSIVSKRVEREDDS